MIFIRQSNINPSEKLNEKNENDSFFEKYLKSSNVSKSHKLSIRDLEPFSDNKNKRNNENPAKFDFPGFQTYMINCTPLNTKETEESRIILKEKVDDSKSIDTEEEIYYENPKPYINHDKSNCFLCKNSSNCQGELKECIQNLDNILKEIEYEIKKAKFSKYSKILIEENQATRELNTTLSFSFDKNSFEKNIIKTHIQEKGKNKGNIAKKETSLKTSETNVSDNFINKSTNRKIKKRTDSSLINKKVKINFEIHNKDSNQIEDTVKLQSRNSLNDAILQATRNTESGNFTLLQKRLTINDTKIVNYELNDKVKSNVKISLDVSRKSCI